jgi:chorismate synthase
MGSTFGKLFRLTTFGESHGAAIGGIIDGCPPRLSIDAECIQAELDRRRPGQSAISSERKETDRIQILSGIFEGMSLGTPIGFVLPNRDADPSAYAPFKDVYRPGHADYVYEQKYGHRDWRGGGRASARETACRVAAGAVARQVLEQLGSMEIVAWVEQVGEISAECSPPSVTREQVEASATRCPCPETAASMEALVLEAKEQGDSLGGRIRCMCRNVPAGLGEPVFDKLEADLAKAMMSIPATKGFSVGSGFSAARMRGSEHNDPFYSEEGRTRTRSNHSGGIQGGISNGMPILLDIAFKPVSTISKTQETVDSEGSPRALKARGRHDPCVVPRAVPIVEAMAALVLCDHLLRQRAIGRQDTD